MFAYVLSHIMILHTFKNLRTSMVQNSICYEAQSWTVMFLQSGSVLIRILAYGASMLRCI